MICRLLVPWTAGWKGRQAWGRVIADLGEQASAMGANAVVGATASAFGAGGGVTNVIGGDAVGVLLMGTAVTVEPSKSVEQAIQPDYTPGT